MKLSRIMLAAPSSGSGKTLITCGLLAVLKKRGLKTAAFKCGPDYIDPMFHSRVLGIKSRNLDPFFTSGEVLKSLMAENAKGFDISVIEGVMGYYDGLSGASDKASAYEVADITDTPVILIVNCKGAGLSVAAQIKGFLDFRENSHIEGVILNRISPGLYKKMKEAVSRETGIKVLGYVPETGFTLESRHLGLLMPGEVANIQEKLNGLSEILEESLDIEGMIALADAAAGIEPAEDLSGFYKWEGYDRAACRPLKIGVASDEAFCFFYADDLDLLKKMGAELVFFSPIRDEHLPEGLDGLLLFGGYPELHAKALSENVSMKKEIKEAIEEGLPAIAQCGGFMYLHESMQAEDGNYYPMAGVIKGAVHKKDSLTRFGYATLSEGKVFGKDAGPLACHEFHYYDSEDPGDAFLAQKPLSKVSWRSMHSSETLLCGFPHTYFYSNKELAKAFMQAALRRRNAR